jgi:hypothetical protein
MIVADAGPIIAFARIGLLDVLRQVVGEIAIPSAVYRELVVEGRGRVGATEVRRSRWIRRRNLAEPIASHTPRLDLHRGEQEAIALAQQLSVPLLIDERRGRAIARRQGLTVLGTLWVLAEAKQQHIVPEVKPLVEAIRSSGYWIDDDLLTEFLREMGEQGNAPP